MTDTQKEILALATVDLENGVNTEWAKFVIALITESASEEEFTLLLINK